MNITVTQNSRKKYSVVYTPGIFWDQYWQNRYPSDLLVNAVSQTRIDLSWINNGIVDYDGVNIQRSTDAINYSVIDTIAAGESSYSDMSCLPETIYYYRVRYFKN